MHPVFSVRAPTHQDAQLLRRALHTDHPQVEVTIALDPDDLHSCDVQIYGPIQAQTLAALIHTLPNPTLMQQTLRTGPLEGLRLVRDYHRSPNPICGS